MAKAVTVSATVAEGTNYLAQEERIARQQLAQDIGQYLFTKEDPATNQGTLEETLQTIALIVAYLAGSTAFIRLTAPNNQRRITVAFEEKPARW